MTLSELRAKLTEASQQKQNDDSSVLNALVRAGVIERKEISTLRAAVRNLKQVGSIKKLPSKHAEIIQRVYSSSLIGTTGSTASINAVRRNLMNGFEFDQTEFMSEAINDPPQMIVLKRKGIRVFPDGKRVALYVNDRLNLNFTIPYGQEGAGVPVAMQEATEKQVKKPSDPTKNFDRLSKVINTGTELELPFHNGGSRVVDKQTAHMIKTLHTGLDDKNKKKLVKFIAKSEGHFDQVLNFAKKRIGKK